MIVFGSFSVSDMERLKNGNAMAASSRSTALAIVADLLRRVNVGAANELGKSHVRYINFSFGALIGMDFKSVDFGFLTSSILSSALSFVPHVFHPLDCVRYSFGKSGTVRTGTTLERENMT